MLSERTCFLDKNEKFASLYKLCA